MKGLFVPAALVAIGAATLAAISKIEAKTTQDRAKLTDLVVQAYTNYRSRREFLRTFNPNAAELAEGKKKYDELLEKHRAKNEEENVKRLEDIQARIDDDFKQTATKRDSCLSNKWEFDRDDFLTELGDYDVEQLRGTLRQIEFSTSEIDDCVRQIEFSSKYWLRLYKMAEFALKLS